MRFQVSLMVAIVLNHNIFVIQFIILRLEIIFISLLRFAVVLIPGIQKFFYY